MNHSATATSKAYTSRVTLHTLDSPQDLQTGSSRRWPLTKGIWDRLFVLAALAYVGSIPLENYGVLGSDVSITALLGLIVLSLAPIAAISRGSGAWVLNWHLTRPIWISLGLLLAYWFVTLFWTSSYGSPATTYIRYVALALLVPALARAIALSGDAAIRIYVISAVVLAALNVDQLRSDPGLLQATVAEQNANGLSLVLSLGLGWAIYLALHSAGKSRYLFAATVPVLLVGNLSTGSRTGVIASLLAIAASLGLTFLKNRNISGNFVFSLVLLSSLWLALVALGDRLPGRLSTVFRDLGDMTSWSARDQLWEGALYLRTDWFWQGIGLGQTKSYVAVFYNDYQVLHNTFLEVAVQSGVVGLILFIMVGISATVVALRGMLRAVFLIALITVLPFLGSLSAEYYKEIWLLPAVAAAGIPLVKKVARRQSHMGSGTPSR